jgi:DNA polymerase-3 subunit delta
MPPDRYFPMPDNASVILLHGSDEFAIHGHIEKICAGLDDATIAGMNIARFDGRNGLDYEALNKAVNTVPFLAPRRVMVLENPIAAFPSPSTRKPPIETLDKDKDDQPPTGSLTEEDERNPDQRILNRKKFLNLLDKAQPTTTIILAEYGELKRDHWLVKWALQASPRAGVHVYNLPKHWEMPRWIESETKKLGGRIEADAAMRLSEVVGEDTRIASQELTKLLTYVNYARPVTLLDVERVSIVSAQGNVFELVDALGQGEGAKAQHVLHQLLEEEEAFKLWGMVIRQFRLLLQARELLDAGASIPEVQKALNLHEFVAQKVSSQAKRFSLSTLESIYHKLLEIDEGAKTSQVPLDLALDMLVVELAKK